MAASQGTPYNSDFPRATCSKAQFPLKSFAFKVKLATKLVEEYGVTPIDLCNWLKLGESILRNKEKKTINPKALCAYLLQRWTATHQTQKALVLLQQCFRVPAIKTMMKRMSKQQWDIVWTNCQHGSGATAELEINKDGDLFAWCCRCKAPSNGQKWCYYKPLIQGDPPKRNAKKRKGKRIQKQKYGVTCKRPKQQTAEVEESEEENEDSFIDDEESRSEWSEELEEVESEEEEPEEEELEEVESEEEEPEEEELEEVESEEEEPEEEEPEEVESEEEEPEEEELEEVESEEEEPEEEELEEVESEEEELEEVESEEVESEEEEPEKEELEEVESEEEEPEEVESEEETEAEEEDRASDDDESEDEELSKVDTPGGCGRYSHRMQTRSHALRQKCLEKTEVNGKHHLHAATESRSLEQPSEEEDECKSDESKSKRKYRVVNDEPKMTEDSYSEGGHQMETSYHADDGIWKFQQKIPSERASQEEQNDANLNSVAPSSEELRMSAD